MEFLYFDINHAINVHDEIIEKSGGVHGILNKGTLESVLEHIKNDEYYESIESKVTHLFYAVNKNHSFSDGNKRASIALSAYFLQINCYDFVVNRFIKEMENIAVDVADNRIDRDLLFEIIYSIIYETDYNETLKIQIYHAKISQEKSF